MAELRYDKLPLGLRGAVQRYIEDGIPPGHFLQAVICNDLREAFGRADDNNRPLLWSIIGWFYNEAPHMCWGSPEAYDDWLQAARNNQ